jgi:PAS domain-containing protein
MMAISLLFFIMNNFLLLSHIYPLQIFLTGISFFISIIAVYFFARRFFYDRVARTFVFLGFFAGLWTLFALIAYLVKDSTIAHIFYIFSLSSLPLFSASILVFARVFYEESLGSFFSLRTFLTKVLIFGVSGLLSMFLVLDGFGITHNFFASISHPTNRLSNLDLGVYGLFLLIIFFTSLLGSSSFFLRILLQTSRKIEKQKNAKVQASYFLGSIVVYIFIGLLYFFELGKISFFLAFSAMLFFFMGGMVYSIQKSYETEAKAVVQKTAISLMWFLVFVRLLFEKGIGAFILSLIVLVLSIFLGVWLMKSTEEEFMLKKELSDINKNLTHSNTNLEWEATQSAREIQLQKTHTDDIINSFSLGVVEHTKDFEILHMNVSAEQMLGLRRREAVGLKFGPDRPETFDKKFHDLKNIVFADILESGQEKNTPKTIFLTKPFVRVVEVSSVKLERNQLEKPKTFYIKILRDVTAKTKNDVLMLNSF